MPTGSADRILPTATAEIRMMLVILIKIEKRHVDKFTNRSHITTFIAFEFMIVRFQAAAPQPISAMPRTMTIAPAIDQLLICSPRNLHAKIIVNT